MNTGSSIAAAPPDLAPRRVWATPLVSLALLLAFFAVIVTIRFTYYVPDDGLNLLFCLPIVAAAVRFGVLGGAACALASTLVFVFWARWHPGPDITVLGYVSRIGAFGTIGVCLGWFARSRRRAREERIRYTRHIARLLAERSRAREAERASISSELHDFVLQGLLVSLMHVERARDEGADADLATIDRLVRDAAVSVRRIMDGIEPIDLEHATTGMLVRQAVAAIERDYPLQVEVEGELDGLPELRDALARQLAFQLLAEALRNVAKHAMVPRARVRAHEGGGGLVLEVVDDGVGTTDAIELDHELSPAFGIGFNLLLEQLLARGGGFHVRSAPGRGTSASFTLPVAAVSSTHALVNPGEASGQTG